MLMILNRMRRRRWPVGVEISQPKYISESAKIGLSSDGIACGGQIEIDRGARIADGVILEAYGGKISIGENVYIGPYSVLYGHGGLCIGRDVMIAAGTKIIPANHIARLSTRPFNELGERRIGIDIGDNVWLGANVVVLDGVSIASNTVIAAGAVVSKNCSEGWIYGGIPARKIKSLEMASSESLVLMSGNTEESRC